MRIFLSLATFAVVASATAKGTLPVRDARALATVPGQRVAAAYMTIASPSAARYVTNPAGESVPFREYNLRFKTDTSAGCPSAGHPVLVGQGMQGDRAQVVFASPGEFSSFIRQRCQ